MTVGILTASRTDNNGTDLQALAMQKIFEKVNGQSIIINYKCDKLENSRKIFYPLSFRGFLNIPYQLEGIKPPVKERVENAKRLLHVDRYTRYLDN